MMTTMKARAAFGRSCPVRTCGGGVGAVGLIAGVLVVLTALPARAQDERRPGPLDDAPAIRHRRELRSGRFEIGAGFGSTIGQDFYNSVLVDLKLGMHISDWLSVSAVLGQSLTEIKTGFTDKLEGSLGQMPSDSKEDARAPTRQEALNGMNKVGTLVTGQLELTPITGKLSLFGRFFAHYDLYAFGGVAAMNLTSDGPECGMTAMVGKSCPVTGFKVGPAVGVGFHAFLSDLVALNFELRDVLISNNPAGRDVNADGVADSNDNTLDQNFFFTANLQFFLPGKAKISD